MTIGSKVHGIALLPGGLFISTNGGTSDALLFDSKDNGLVATFPAGKKPDAVVWDAKTGLVAVMNGDDGTVTLIDVAQRVVAGTLVVGGKLEFAAANGQGGVFVNVEDRNEIVELGLPTRKIIDHHALPGCESPTGLALDNMRNILVAACSNAVAIAISALDGRKLASLPIGKGPDAVISDEKGQRFLIPCGRDGVLTVISDPDHGTPQVIGTVLTGAGDKLGIITCYSPSWRERRACCGGGTRLKFGNKNFRARRA